MLSNHSSSGIRNKPLLKARSIYFLLFCFAALASYIHNLHGFYSRSDFVPLSEFLPDSCHFIGHNLESPGLLQSNTRALCLASSVCVSSQYPSSTFFLPEKRPPPRCSVLNPDLSPVAINSSLKLRELQSCAELQRKTVVCAHGSDYDANNASCPRIDSLNFAPGKNIRWFENISILVPAYPFPGSIYHFASVATTVAYIADNLERLLRNWTLPDTPHGYYKSCRNCPMYSPRNLNIIFRQSTDILQFVNWQRQLMQAIVFSRMKPLGLNVRVYHLKPNPSFEYVCIRNAVVLGLRGHLNMWAFPNSSSVPLDGYSAPVDAVRFKQTVYNAFELNITLPSKIKPVSELPPLVLGYARRDAPRDPPPGAFVDQFFTRRFSDADEGWFLDMLRNETRREGIKLHVFTTSRFESLKKQVENIVKVGFLVGIHGANLVNCMFMHPFGALLEISPAQVREECYIGGINSGLAYWRLEMSQLASPEESRCRHSDIYCKEELKLRLVKMGAEKDREQVRALVQKGIRHIVSLHRDYPDGIPVRYNRETGYMDIARTKQKEGNTLQA